MEEERKHPPAIIRSSVRSPPIVSQNRYSNSGDAETRQELFYSFFAFYLCYGYIRSYASKKVIE